MFGTGYVYSVVEHTITLTQAHPQTIPTQEELPTVPGAFEALQTLKAKGTLWIWMRWPSLCLIHKKNNSRIK